MHSFAVYLLIYLFTFQYFFNLAVLHLSCYMWDLPCIVQDLSLQLMDSLVVVRGLSSYGTWAYLLHGICDFSSPTRD